VLFAEAWADSITEAFGHSAGVHAALALHYREVAALEAQISPPLLQLLQSTLPLRRPPGEPGGDSDGEASDEEEAEEEAAEEGA
jgi:hypothetical protein